jgi:hypothetical protein
MANNPRKRQKKMERRAAKRKEKKHLRVRDENAGLVQRLTDAARYPILHCWISESLHSKGLGWVVLSRELSHGSVAVACFLVDRCCLGVKDAFAHILIRPAYDSKYPRKLRSEMALDDAGPAAARKLLEEAVAYARRIGFSPHPDYQKAILLFGDVDPQQSDATFEFGKDGKPFFISGPNDTPERCRQILAILTNTCGPGQFDYIVMVPGSESVELPSGAFAHREAPHLTDDEDNFDDEE